jgi:signal transduction histidine kinase/DNA-binding response OmpR family regulator
MKSVVSDPQMFDGPGECRSLLSSVDWAQSPIGDMSSWSPVLKTMVGVCLSSGFPIVIHWGPELVALYNDAFIPVIRGRHPAAFGRPAKDIWPEEWERVGPRLLEVTGQGHTLQAEDEQQISYRNGYPEECYFSYSHSPIIDTDGVVAGSFTIASETTAKVLYERRMRVVRELGALSVTESGNSAETCLAALQVLQTARRSMPFAMAFLMPDGEGARCVAHYGLAGASSTTDPGAIELPDVVELVIRTGRPEEVTGLRDRFPGAIAPGPLGELIPDSAVVLPLTVSGRPDPVGALALGVSPYRPLDDEYRWFFGLICRQIRVALTDTLAYEAERQRVQVLAELDRAKMEFFQNVSHELRTPLTLLLAPLQDMLAASDHQPAAQEDLQAAVRAAERLRTMVDALLDFSGAEAGALTPDRQPCDLAAVTAEVASMFRSTAEHAGLELVVQMPETPVTAVVDRSMWSTVVTNLLSNAVKYTSIGRIDLRLSARDADAVLVVSDTGQGIPAEEQARVFDRFYRSPTDEIGRGAGIGLALIADLVRAHDGFVDVQSAPGEGTTFTVSVPLGVAQGGARPPESVPDNESAAGLPGVLLVEDDADLRAYLTRLLTRDGWAVQAVASAEDGLAALAATAFPPVDLVLTDLVLPGRSGLELVTELRANPALGRLPIVILTARGGPDAAVEGLSVGADDYITKPFSSSELLARLRANHELQQLREGAVTAAEGRVEQVRSALDSNRAIGTAVGIMMATYQLTAKQGFQLLVSASQNTNSKLRDIAAQVIGAGALPFRPTMIDDLLIRVAPTKR